MHNIIHSKHSVINFHEKKRENIFILQIQVNIVFCCSTLYALSYTLFARLHTIPVININFANRYII